jgi:hypothetical protein
MKSLVSCDHNTTAYRFEQKLQIANETVEDIGYAENLRKDSSKSKQSHN